MSGSDPQSLFNVVQSKQTYSKNKTKYIIFGHKSNVLDFSDLNLFRDKENIDRIAMDCNENSFKLTT